MSDKMPNENFDGYYIVNRDPNEIRHMLEWAKFEERNTTDKKHWAAMRGILLAFGYLLDPDAPKPTEYKGLFTRENILKDNKEPDIMAEHCLACLHKIRDKKIGEMFKIANNVIDHQYKTSPDQ